MATRVFGADNWLTINGKPLSFLKNDENLAANVRENEKSTIRITSHAPDEIQISIDGIVLETARQGIWTWTPREYAGLYELQVSTPDFPKQVALVRVFPEKLTQQRYEQMQSDLSTIANDLLFRLNTLATEKVVGVARFQDTSPLHDYRQVRILFEHLDHALSYIRHNPHKALHNSTEQQFWHEVSHFSYETHPLVGEMIVFPAPIAQICGTPYFPASWEVQRSTLTYDVYENRLLKQFIQKQLVTKLSIIQERATEEIKRRNQILSFKLMKQWLKENQKREELAEIEKLRRVIEECKQMKRRCLAWGNEPFLRNVKMPVHSGKASQVLLKNPYYSSFYHLYLMFQQQLKISLNTEDFITNLALRKVSDLYELWSVFQVTKLVLDELETLGYQPQSNSIFYEVEKDYFHFDVRKNVSSIVMTKDSLRVEMKYEPVYPNYMSVGNVSALVSTLGNNNPLTPDMVIEIYDQQRPRSVIVFDAKYSWEKGLDGWYYPLSNSIDKMHTYYNSIQYRRHDHRRPSRRPQPIVSSAYILFPGNRLYREPNNRVGGLPLTPNMAQVNLAKVREAIRDILRFAHLL